MIYFIQENTNGPIKVGTCVALDQRINQLQTGNPRLLQVIKTIPGHTAREAQIRKDLKQFHIRGEWFRAESDVLEYINELQNVSYEKDGDRAYAIIWRDEHDSMTDFCPFCGKRHYHGTDDGHRVKHCHGGSTEIKTNDGTVLLQDHGYIIKTRPKKNQTPVNKPYGYATFHKSKIFHIAQITTSNKGFDSTLCSQPLSSRNGVNVWNSYEGGHPTPTVTAEKPEGKRICKYCEKINNKNNHITNA
ncbi:MAG: GIY-YIG nuclease family protein [Desulfocapsaceae bacterium]|nr:GIY-YIG nuclease family protein [Desulfocapsaceae bacterium]